ncbi:uncharacterized protein B0H64DRAFT_443495 [Chaetomium fimeti]|uniref:Uncharacterized protein n=1 Tax=Chaetomium fimeti TaxID=1854472 RepID=A0AAE0HDJ2_9PEZI|nr:hypothetical protein B0H64DRAFT_443495 [Chaetomium fimeti]
MKLTTLLLPLALLRPALADGLAIEADLNATRDAMVKYRDERERAGWELVTRFEQANKSVFASEPLEQGAGTRLLNALGALADSTNVTMQAIIAVRPEWPVNMPMHFLVGTQLKRQVYAFIDMKDALLPLLFGEREESEEFDVPLDTSSVSRIADSYYQAMEAYPYTATFIDH